MSQEAADEFERRYRLWRDVCARDDVMESSSDAPYIDNDQFRAIVAMGEAAVPHIIEKLRADPDAHFLIHALEPITGKRFGEDELLEGRRRYGEPLGNQGMAKMWIDWWESNGGR